MHEGSGPDWVRDALRQTRDEIAAFVRTAVDFSLKPARFALEWAGGSRHALNPLGFLATAFAVVGPATALAQRFLHEDEAQQSLVLGALGALLPFAYYILLGAFQHGVLRLCGSRRPLRDTVAMALYAGGGPATALNLLFLGVIVAHARWYGPLDKSGLPFQLAMLGFVMLIFFIFWTTLSTAQRALHAPFGISGWHIVLANLTAMVATGMLFALLRPPGEFGLHLMCGPTRSGGAWKFICILGA